MTRRSAKPKQIYLSDSSSDNSGSEIAFLQFSCSIILNRKMLVIILNIRSVGFEPHIYAALFILCKFRRVFELVLNFTISSNILKY